MSITTFFKEQIHTLKPFDRATTDPLRGLLALLIVAHHLSPHIQIPILGTFLPRIGEHIVAIFFLLSGYGLFVSFKHKGASYLNGFFKKRFSKILPLFILLTIIEIIAAWLGGRTLTHQAVSFATNGDTPLPFSWFIYAIIYAYIAFYFSALIGKTLMRTGMIFLAINVAYMAFICCYCKWGGYWYVTLPAINLGYYIGFYDDKITGWLQKYPVMFLVGSIGLIICLFCITPSISYLSKAASLPFIYKMLTLMFICVGIMFQVTCVYILIRLLGMLKWKPLMWVGAFSMELYLVHGMVLTRLSDIMQGYNEILFVCATYAISIFLAYMTHKIFSRIKF
ncbi:MAG: acyltransferase family protein [Muribaculaceae bacterium]|nr:acyltransferase family protein [Muribaculaceae bacterium]